MKPYEITSRYEPMPQIVTCAIRILRDGKWYQMRLFDATYKYCKEVIERLRRKGRVVNVTYLIGD